MFGANRFEAFGYTSDWSTWVITAWLFLFILHFTKVFITDRFMNKDWERDQISRLVAQQQKKIDQLQTKVEDDTATKPQ